MRPKTPDARLVDQTVKGILAFGPTMKAAAHAALNQENNNLSIAMAAAGRTLGRESRQNCCRRIGPMTERAI